MKLKFTYFFLISILTWTFFTSDSTGKSTFQSCAQAGCHSGGGGVTTVDSIVLVDAQGNSYSSASSSTAKYKPSTAYTIKLYGTNTSSLSKFGFQVTSNGKGTFSNPATNSKIFTTGVWSHSTPIAGTSGKYTITATWTSPAVGSLGTQFNAYINAVNGNNATSGDNCSAKYTTEFVETSTSDTAKVTIALTSGTLPTKTGNSLTFTATAINGGSNPQFQWKLNGNNVGTASSVNTYTTTTLKANDSVWCVLTSNLSGVVGSPASSNKIKITTIGGASISSQDQKEVYLIPVTASSDVYTLHSYDAQPVQINVIDLSGKLLISKEIYPNGVIDFSRLNKGVYVVHFMTKNGFVSKKLSLN